MNLLRVLVGIGFVLVGAWIGALISKGSPGDEAFGVTNGWWYLAAIAAVLIIGGLIILWTQVRKATRGSSSS